MKLYQILVKKMYVTSLGAGQIQFDFNVKFKFKSKFLETEMYVTSLGAGQIQFLFEFEDFVMLKWMLLEFLDSVQQSNRIP